MVSTNLNNVTLPETKSLPLKIDGWKTLLSFWDGLFSGAKTLVSGSVVNLGSSPPKFQGEN